MNKIYLNPNYHRNLIGSDNKKRSIIYQWINLITGKIYIGSAWNGSSRLLSYWRPSILCRNYPIYNNINYYGIHNFALAILEDLGISGSVTKEYRLLLPPMVNLVACVEEKIKDNNDVIKFNSEIKKLTEPNLIPMNKKNNDEKKFDIMETVGIKEVVKKKIFSKK